MVVDAQALHLNVPEQFHPALHQHGLADEAQPDLGRGLQDKGRHSIRRRVPNAVGLLFPDDPGQLFVTLFHELNCRGPRLGEFLQQYERWRREIRRRTDGDPTPGHVRRADPGEQVERRVVGMHPDAQVAHRQIAPEVVLTHQSEVIVLLAELLAMVPFVTRRGGRDAGGIGE